jgi:DNA-binding transcriptional LysR family regulator
MDSKFLKTFIAVVDTGSLAAASRKLNITPAAVAQQIRALERQIEAPLIRRAGRTVAVTEAGARILERSRNLLSDIDDLHAVAKDDSMGGELRLGAGGTALTGVLPDILARTATRFPQISILFKRGCR